MTTSNSRSFKTIDRSYRIKVIFFDSKAFLNDLIPKNSGIFQN
ncbi:hypothetical protein LEP1GSC103_2213 [Leptospira borgpetersenii serovar Javanica str. UI 09931]|uniref:Uncharacterized protein n=1 Tax=Leptospira borgpetersenii serovar Javanica str. UI 09931 TaxID=1049767 RepID=A0AAV3JBY7_LEPBO|nr:hypothetical protein LEP1GSC101_1716 [Leptospira borgpetersenii str. UI 09149]EKR00028.1 hypothetical protein LEP1GSC121_3621 [Leptospira borgpetersenii serovar Castellonis str. 200801910]EMK11548.1 hypothetical protein LEP1GSC066_2104 [Leptospira sp. serovar Kenya str. Sh9]EMN11307.1 hypothetical protein LEP1GSC055_0052 [Leptospira borgpetersenii str. Brem 307]EMN57487.1 hypothetical protein LEP1GSC090_2310 [Leptospira borgpetersenii serovar Javanica str. MK146]EPG58195.1 hypothetical prot